MTEKYKLLMYAVHSCLENNRKDLIIDQHTTVDNFRNNEVNEKYCLEIHKWALDNWDYDLSWNQMANGINLFLKAHKKANEIK